MSRTPFCISLLGVLLLTTAGHAFAAKPASQGDGRVTLYGQILDSACSVDTASRDQTIDMLSQPVSEVVSENMGLSRPFSIRLVNCTLGTDDNPGAQYFRVTFDGPRDDNEFAVSGDAEGVALQIRDKAGNVAVPGEPMPEGTITSDNMKLNYTMRLVADGQDPQAGAYHTTIRYKLDYY